MLAASVDIAFLLDDTGAVRDLVIGQDMSGEGSFSRWVGHPFIDTVAPDSRAKAEALIRDARAGAVPRAREINHKPTSGQATVPIRYVAVRDGADRGIFLVGRDLSALAALQQQLVASQQAMEREYTRLRSAETRYRVLFQMTSEPALIVDVQSRRIVEANAAALDLLSPTTGRVSGRTLAQALDSTAAGTLQEVIGRAAASGERAGERVALNGHGEFDAAASVFRHDGAAHAIIRLSPLTPGGVDPQSRAALRLASLIQAMPDGFVVTNGDGEIIDGNSAFLDLVQLTGVDQARGRPLDEWLGRAGVDFRTLAKTLAEFGMVRGFVTILRGRFGTTEEVEVTAVVSRPVGESAIHGYVIRRLGRSGEAQASPLGQTPEQLAGLVGRVPLKELVRQTTDLIERMCIETALRMTGDNRASAADMLGLSRQSLYLKLRRFDLGDSDIDGGDGA